jgi:UDP-N-acetylglucosamine 2-epimerase (non-hydrolysing)
VKILFIVGTRPEAIKLAPLIIKLKEKQGFQVKVCTSGQHKELLQQVLDFFSITPDYRLDVMQKDQSLSGLTVKLIDQLDKVLNENKPDLIIVQGDTTTAFVGALAGNYHKIKVAHIEAGLRSENKYEPFPEELNRKMISQLTDYHFAPTSRNVNALQVEGIKKHIYEVGNTVIDSLIHAEKLIKERNYRPEFFSKLKANSKWIVMTGHRRENFGEPIRQMFEAIKEIIQLHKDVEVVFPVHFNPNVRSAIDILENDNRIHLMDPVSYEDMVCLMKNAYMIITDSGGIQEEAPYFGKPVLVTRNVTERQEGIEAGTSVLVGTSKERIIEVSGRLLKDIDYYSQFSKIHNPYGDGNSSRRIIQILEDL